MAVQTITTASDVRSFYLAPEQAERLASLSEAARLTITGRDGKAPRGRLHPEVRADFNSDHKGKSAYGEGTPRTIEVTYKRTQPSGRKVKATTRMTVDEARAWAVLSESVEVGERGPLSEAALEAAGEAFAASLVQA